MPCQGCPQVKQFKKDRELDVTLGMIRRVVLLSINKKPNGALYLGRKEWTALVDSGMTVTEQRDFCNNYERVPVNMDSYCKVAE